MVVTNEVFEQLESEIEGVRTYSGRGMYGSECLGIDADSEWQVLGSIGALIEQYDMGDEILDVLMSMRDTKPHTDSMGMGIIVYWPHISIAAE